MKSAQSLRTATPGRDFDRAQRHLGREKEERDRPGDIMDWLSLFFTPIKPFIAHPECILAVATALFVILVELGWTRRCWPLPLLWAAGLWAAVVIWEWLILVQTPDANIRADLLLIYPVLLITMLWAFWTGLRSRQWPE